MPKLLPDRLSVPGNLLLAGEYAVLLEGGLGYTCAIDSHVTCSWHPSKQWRIHAIYPHQDIHWHPGADQSFPFLEAAWETVTTHLGMFPERSTFQLTLNSAALARANGRKAGLGSSAAAMVGLIAALLFLHQHKCPELSEVFTLALLAHRQAQGGQGSGYDIACSTFGGIGCFTGGRQPQYRPLARALPLPLFLLSAPHPMSTPPAIRLWRQWCDAYPYDVSSLVRNQHQTASPSGRT